MQQLAGVSAPIALDDYAITLIGAVLERLCVPFLVLDASGMILFDNALSARVLADGRHMRRRADGRIEAGAGLAARLMRDFLAALHQPIEDIDLSFPVPGAAPLHASLTRFVAPVHPLVAPLPPLAVLFFRPASDVEAMEALRSVYGLSETEARVVRNAIAGVALREQASTGGVSIHTIRKQFNTAMQKVGVSSKLQLAAHLEELGRIPDPSRPLKQRAPY